MSNLSTFNNSYKLTLEKGSKKHLCPSCGKKTFVRYINTDTNNYLPLKYGRCDRESKCSYHLNPYTDEYAKAIDEEENKITGITKITFPKKSFSCTQSKSQPTAKRVFIPVQILKRTLKSERYNQNVFIQNLLTRVAFPFEASDIEKVIALYYLGTITNGYRAGAVTFPFIDIRGNIRAIQVKEFNELNNTTGTDFLHSIIEKHHTRNCKVAPEWLDAYQKQDKLISCLFGEHLLSKFPMNPVALVEAPKTAIYGTLYFGFPEHPKNFIWLAVYNKSSFSFDKMEVLDGRDVYTFPDLSKDGSTFREWKDKAREFEDKLPGTRFIFSDLLEKLAPKADKYMGNDLADYLIRLDWHLFREKRSVVAYEERIETNSIENQICYKSETSPQPNYQTIGEVLDMMKEQCEDKLPPNFLGANAGIWKTQIKHPYLKN